jgi:hypothetical protein
MKIPIIINNRNLLTWPSKMVEVAKTFEGVGDIIIVDNQSTYEPLLEWYKTNPCEIVYADENHGQGCPWIIELPQSRGYEYYVVSDPDMGLENTPKDNLLYLIEKMEKYPEYDRIGLSISNLDLDPRYPFFDHAKSWKERTCEPDTIFDGLLTKQIFDTTYGMYHKNRNKSGISCCTKEPYSMVHLPWNISRDELHDIKNVNYEFYYYLKHATNVSSYKGFTFNEFAFR